MFSIRMRVYDVRGSSMRDMGAELRARFVFACENGWVLNSKAARLKICLTSSFLVVSKEYHLNPDLFLMQKQIGAPDVAKSGDEVNAKPPMRLMTRTEVRRGDVEVYRNPRLKPEVTDRRREHLHFPFSPGILNQNLLPFPISLST